MTPRVDFLTEYNDIGSGLGHGVGVDFGFAWVTDRVELGLGINDVSTTLTWPKNRQERISYDSTTNDIVSTLVAPDVEQKTRIPTAYVLTAEFEIAGTTTVGAEVRDAGFGTVVRVGAEHRIGPLALRAGVNRDLRNRPQVAMGTGLRLGPVSLDVALASNSNSLSATRGWVLASSISIY